MNRNQGSKSKPEPSNPKAKLPSNPKPSTTQPSSSNLPLPQQFQDPQSLSTTKTTPSPPSNPSDPKSPSSLLPTLTPALEILSRFHHRNKNQHRLPKWWAEADMLRRHLRKLIEAANEWCDKEPEREGRRRKEEVRRRKKAKYERLGRVEKKQDGAGEKGGEEEDNGEDREEEKEDKEAKEVRLRAEYLRGKLGPRAYFAFSQLSADRQFAHLGLMLLGILAQVDKVLSAFAPVPIENDDAAADEAAEDRSPNLNATVIDQLADDVPNRRHNDIGVAVSREELLAMMSASTASGPTEGSLARRDARDQPMPTTETDFGAPPPAAATGENRQGKDKSGKKRLRDNEDENDDEDKDDSSSGLTQPVSEKKKKKKRKIGDDEADIDDIFASFDKSSQRDKNKKKKDKAEKSVVATKTTSIAGAKTTTVTAATATATATKVKTTTDSSVPITTTSAEAETRHGKDDFDDIFASLEKPKKKKTKVKKTDDLDDIFASFDKPKTKKKKKTGAGADEFDDIFGGL